MIGTRAVGLPAFLASITTVSALAARIHLVTAALAIASLPLRIPAERVGGFIEPGTRDPA